KCDKCGNESGELYCGKCRKQIKQSHNLIPILFYDKSKKGYRAGCTVTECPYNENGACVTVILFISMLKNILHEFDGDNIVQQWCG
ncbi:MAG: hypothetical protein WC365_06745, partial [Candidatus Babeliales bacterium]